MTYSVLIPRGLIASLENSRGPRVLLLRHGDRYPITPGESGAEVALTPEGERRVETLEQYLAGEPRWAMSSPLIRCVRTTSLLGLTAGISPMLGDPGPFVIDAALGGQVFGTHGTENVVRQHLLGNTWGCLRPLAEGGGLLLAFLRQHLFENATSGVAVSHDAIVMPLIGWVTGERFSDDWLSPLDGAVLTADALFWKGRRFEVSE